MLSRALSIHAHVQELLVHSGQHYDENLSDVFFSELNLPKPAAHLQAGQGTSEEQYQRIFDGFTAFLRREKPQAVIVYGDTTTTLAGARAAHELHIPVAHVEAGLRSYNPAMPEEYNRAETDKISRWLFVPTTLAINNLAKEGITDSPAQQVVLVGDVMLDAVRIYSKKAKKPRAIEDLDEVKPMMLITLHRNFNADNPEKINRILKHLCDAAPGLQLIFPVHPRTRKNLKAKGLPSNLHLIEPVSYFEMLWLENHAHMIATDSGGVQKEAFFFKKPLVILREETEWQELIDAGVAVCTGDDAERIAATVRQFTKFIYPDLTQFYGDAHAAEKISYQIAAL